MPCHPRKREVYIESSPYRHLAEIRDACFIALNIVVKRKCPVGACNFRIFRFAELESHSLFLIRFFALPPSGWAVQLSQKPFPVLIPNSSVGEASVLLFQRANVIIGTAVPPAGKTEIFLPGNTAFRFIHPELVTGDALPAGKIEISCLVRSAPVAVRSARLEITVASVPGRRDGPCVESVTLVFLTFRVVVFLRFISRKTVVENLAVTPGVIKEV